MVFNLSRKAQIVPKRQKLLSINDSNIFLLIFIICFIYSLWALSIGWNNTILDQHAFRQTQTAISAYYIIQGGPWLAYETPVLGAPWSIPFEFPLYQWIVAILVKIFHTPLDQTGRFVSVVFFYLSLIPSYIILGCLNISKSYRWIFLSLFLTSPLYLFWSRTFMIESTALFFSLAYLAAVACYYRHKKLIFIALAILCGLLGALVKITTFAGFLLAASLFTLFNWLKHGKSRTDIVHNIIIPVLAFLLVPYIATSIWTHFADSQKLLNPFAVDLTSKALTEWNFGTWEQRFSFKFLKALVRTIKDVCGDWILGTILLVTLPIFSRRKHLYFASITIFFVVMLTFTNLHIIHNYYQYANGIFIIAAISFCLLDLLEKKDISKLFAYGILALLLVIHIAAYQAKWSKIAQSTIRPTIEVTEAIKKYTSPDDVLFIVNNDGDWSSEIPYYSQRRALISGIKEMLSPNESKMKVALKQLSKYRLGSLVLCKKQRLNLQNIVVLTTNYHFQTNAVYSNSFCEIHLPLIK